MFSLMLRLEASLKDGQGVLALALQLGPCRVEPVGQAGRRASFRRRAALGRKQKAGRPQSYATIKDLDTVSPSDNQPST